MQRLVLSEHAPGRIRLHVAGSPLVGPAVAAPRGPSLPTRPDSLARLQDQVPGVPQAGTKPRQVALDLLEETDLSCGRRYRLLVFSHPLHVRSRRPGGRAGISLCGSRVRRTLVWRHTDSGMGPVDDRDPGAGRFSTAYPGRHRRVCLAGFAQVRYRDPYVIETIHGGEPLPVNDSTCHPTTTTNLDHA